MGQKIENMFRDEAVMIASAGDGGSGCRSFHREKYVNMGGPDGGDGGRGGSIAMTADAQENSLFRVSRNYHANAGNGQPGGSNNKSGRSGEDLTIHVPVGTQIYDFERGNLLADLKIDGESVVVCKGGKPGRGNARFATSVNQAPERAEKGLEGETRKLRLELKLVADVGLLGLPNAGKSTFIRRVTAARPRVAEYPFTTLDPSLGILDFGDLERQIVIADIPGLIEGAHEGKGLGHQFLRHVERTRVLLHLVDCSSMASDAPEEAYRVIRGELEGYSAELASRPTMVVATKVEDDESAEIAKNFFATIGHPERCISSASGKGLEAMLKSLQTLVANGEEA
jgi:GTP-binding protein